MIIKQYKTNEQILLLDNEIYYVVVEKDSSKPENSTVFLKYCVQNSNADQYIGYAHVILDQSWEVRIHAIYDDVRNTDTESIGSFDTQIDAIVVLWQSQKTVILQ